MHVDAKRSNTHRTPLLFVVMMGLTAFLFITGAGPSIDIAPPEQPPGSNISPGGQTEVMMVSERVIIEVSAGGEVATARVTADFNMRNTGAAAETMQVRFPLGGVGDGRGGFPEVVGFSAGSGGTQLATTVITTPNPQGGDPIPWAAFEVTFPAGQDFPVNVTYSITATGYPPSARFAYVLETGAGWKGPISTADIIVRLPYEATNENIFYGDQKTSPGANLSGNEVRWHWEGLEPTASDNIYVTMLMPEAWQRILEARGAVMEQPGSTEALLRLVQAYRGAITTNYPRAQDDPFADLAEETMSGMVALQPDSAEAHLAYAQLLWENMGVQAQVEADDPYLKRVLAELGAALALEPDNAQAQKLLGEIRPAVQGTVILPTAEVSGRITPTGGTVPTLTPADVPTPDIRLSPGIPTPAPGETASPPVSSDALRPTSTPGANVAVAGDASRDMFIALILGALTLPLVLVGVWYAVSRGRRAEPQ